MLLSVRRKWKPQASLVGRSNVAAVVANSSVASQKGGHRPAMQPSKFTSGYRPHSDESRGVNRHWLTNVHYSILDNSQKVETAQGAINK